MDGSIDWDATWPMLCVAVGMVLVTFGLYNWSKLDEEAPVKPDHWHYMCDVCPVNDMFLGHDSALIAAGEENTWLAQHTQEEYAERHRVVVQGCDNLDCQYVTDWPAHVWLLDQLRES